VIFVVAVAVSIWRLAERPAGRSEMAGSGGESSVARSTPAAVPDSSGPEPGSLPPSLVGTAVPGGLAADASGRLVPNPDVLRFMEYWAQARGEEPAPVLRARVETAASAGLPPSAAAEMLVMYDQYLRYLDEGRVFEALSTEPQALAKQYDEQRILRSEIFGPSVAYALFREQAEVERVTLERRRIIGDPTLTDRQRIAQLAELRRRLPEEVQKAESEAYSDLRLARDDPGPAGDPTEGAFPTDAAVDVPPPDASWATRMQAYREERERVLYNVRNAPEEAKSVFLRRVRERHFDVEELPRVEALDRIEVRDRTLGRAPVLVD
jgi:lipase chaperone LimK